jgi:hypothetical protein|tara:strand:+ start:168 stop:374 length:207 start_codon:yes stop_codon:yes gene_type:complete
MFVYYILCTLSLFFTMIGGWAFVNDFINIENGQMPSYNDILGWLSFCWVYIFACLVKNKSIFENRSKL